jgi:glycosyltransferase involved in cell wall biosynthesis
VRLAWFTPWPPQPSGIAGRSADLARGLAARGHGIDVFVDHRAVGVAASPDEAVAFGQVRVQSAHDFPWRHALGQFDLVVYQAGNSRQHDFLWPYLFRYPGVTILHDARLHHARARTLLVRGREEAYRAEFTFDHPDADPDAAELAVAGFDGPYYYLWPMTRAILDASRLVAVHAPGAAQALAAELPGRPLHYLPLGMGREMPVPDAVRARVRRGWGAGAETVVFGVFGGLSMEKRLEPALRAFARTTRRHPHARLVLAGAEVPDVDTRALSAALGITDAVVHAGVLDDEAFEDALASVDVSLHLRWPTSLETSGPWVQALAAGRPTILIDLVHQAHVPALDPQTWRPRHGTRLDPVAIAIEILDEEHSLGLAMDRLASDADLRATLGAAARRYWEAEHTVDRMTRECESLLARALEASSPTASLPAALRPDVWASTRAWLEPFGDLPCELP